MTTTELIKILQRVERGASGRSRVISLSIYKDRESEDSDMYLPEPEFIINSTGDGVCGAELDLVIYTG
jgi:hypothetical protein